VLDSIIMASASTATTLTEQQMKKTLSGKKRKSIPGRTVLCSPYVAKWPQVASCSQKEIINKLKTFLECHRSPVMQCRVRVKTSPGAATAAGADDITLKSATQCNNIRKHIVCGVQKVTRCLEQDRLSLVVVDRSSPWQLHQHLAQLAAVRHCPAVAVDNLASTLSPLLGVTRLCAVGLLKIVDGVAEESLVELSSVISSVAALCPSIELSWLESSQHIEQLHKSLVADKTALADSMISHKSTDVDRDWEKPKDYSHLYVLKKPEVMNEKAFGEFIALPSSSDDDDDVDDDEKLRGKLRGRNRTRKDREMESLGISKCGLPSMKRKTFGQRKRSVYKSPNTGVQVANGARKHKMK